MPFPQHRPGMCSVKNSQIDTCDVSLQNLQFNYGNNFCIEISFKIRYVVIFKTTVCMSDLYKDLT